MNARTKPPGTVRVLHVLPHRGGGAETYIDMLERLEGFAHRRFYLSRGRTPASGLASIPARWPRMAAQTREADVIHCHGDTASIVALPLLRTRPAITTCHGLHMLRRARKARRNAVERAFAAVAGASRFIVCLSRDEHDHVAPIVRPRDREKLRIIHNGVDPPAALSAAERASVRRELGVGPDAVLGLFVGQLEPRKRPRLAAMAATRAREAGAPFVLAVAGDGPEAPHLQELAGSAVRLLGYRRDVPKLLGAAEVFVQASEREGMSFALLEAMSNGLAVVAADSSSNPEALADTGLLYPGGDETALADALIRLSSDPELRARLGAAARKRVLEQFSPADFLSATATLYRQALGDAKAPGPAFAGGRA